MNSERVEFETADGGLFTVRTGLVRNVTRKANGEVWIALDSTCGVIHLDITTPYPEAVERVWPSKPAASVVVWKRPGEAGRVEGKRYLVLRDDGWYSWVWRPNDSYDGWGVDGVTAWAELPALPDWAKGGA